MENSKIAKIIGPITLIIGIILVITGVTFLSLGFFIRPNIGMGFDEFRAAMNLSSQYSFMGIGFLAGGSFVCFFGFLISIFGGAFSRYDSFSSKSKPNVYANANPYLKGGKSKEIIRCSYCQAEIQNGLKVCSECGTEL